MAEKVFDVRGEVDIDTKKARDAIDRMARSTRAFGDAMLQSDRISVSLTRRLRSGFNTGMAAALRRDEGGFIALGNAIQVASAGLKKIENESVLTLRVFQRLQRVGFATQSALGALAGSIGDLAGGFLSLVGVIGQASYALIGVGGALASVIGGFAVAKIAMSGVGKAVSQLWNGQNQYNRSLRDARKELKDLKFDLEGAVLSEKEAAIELEKARTQLAMAQDLPPDNMVRREAELAYQRADLNYRRAKARVNDLQDTIKRGGRAAGSAANADPFRNLTKSQIAFAKYLATLKPIMQALKEASASSFLPPLQTAIETIVSKAFPTLEAGFKVIGSAMGDASNSFATAFTRSENLELLKQFFDDSAPRLRDMGIAAGKFFGGLLGTLAAAKPLTDQFTTWISSISARFELLSKSKSFKRTLDLAAYVSTQLGHVFGGFADGIKNIMDANFPPGGGGAGQVLLDWLNGIALGFKKFTGSETFATWLKDTTTNATVMLGVIGDFLNIFIELSGRPEIKEFWTTLGKSIPDITKVLLDGLKAAPAFAALIVSVIDLFSAFSDTESISIFFDTLRSITDVFAAIFNNPVIKAILDFIGRINAVVLAVTLAISTMVLVGVGIGAILGQVAKNIGKLFAVGTGTLKWMTRFNLELAVGKPGIIGWGKALYKSIFGAINPAGKLASTMDVLKESFRKNKIVFKEWLKSIGLLREGQSRFSKFVNAVKVGFSALKATVADAALYIRTSLTDAMKKFRDVAGNALGNARFALYTTLIQKGRLVSDFYNTRVMPVMTKFRDLIVNKFNDARLAIYGTLQQKGRMIADLYNTRVVPAFQRFMSTISPQAIRIKMLGFAMGMMMHIDLLDKRIIPAFIRLGAGIKNGIARMQEALRPANIQWQLKQFKWQLSTWVQDLKRVLSPENIRLKTLGFRMGMMFHIDLLSKSIVPAFIKISGGIRNAVTQIGTALSPQNIQAKMAAIADSIRLGVAKIGAALSPESIRLKTLGFRMGLMMNIDLIDKRIVPAFMKIQSSIAAGVRGIGTQLLKLSYTMKNRFKGIVMDFASDFRVLGATARMFKMDMSIIGKLLGQEIVAKFTRFKNAVMQSTAMIKLNTAATKLAAAASQMWNGFTSRLSNVFKSTKDSLTGFIDRIKAKTTAVQASATADIAAAAASGKKTKAYQEEAKAAAAAAGARRGGGGMALMGAGFAAQGLISGAMGGGMTAGSALTTLGGAMMFIPGGMIAGLVVGIVGAIVQGFESAAAAQKQKNIDILVENADILAQNVTMKDEQFSKEQSTLLASGNFTDLAAVTDEIIRRQGIATAQAQGVIAQTGIKSSTSAGLIRTATEEARQAFVDSGVKISEAQMPALLRAVAINKAYNQGANNQDIAAGVLAVFQAGDVAKLASTYKVDPNAVVEQRGLTPGAPLQTVVRTRGETDMAADMQRIRDYIFDPANQIGRYEGSAASGFTLTGLPDLDTSGLANLPADALTKFLGNQKNINLIAKKLDPSALTQLRLAADEGKYTKPQKPGQMSDKGFVWTGGDFWSSSPKFLTTIKGIVQSEVSSGAASLLPKASSLYSGSGMFNTGNVANIMGTDARPLVTSIKASDIAAIKGDPNVATKTITALDLLSGVVDKDGGFLQIKDMSRTDNIAPQIYIPATGLTGSEKTERENINKWLRESWKKG